jgi:hypothetical protein
MTNRFQKLSQRTNSKQLDAPKKFGRKLHQISFLQSKITMTTSAHFRSSKTYIGSYIFSPRTIHFIKIFKGSLVTQSFCGLYEG